MAIKPILFNTEMVRAILDGRKTCTRRVPNKRVANDYFSYEAWALSVATDGCKKMTEKQFYEQYPPYKPGDILYVRETWQCLCDLDGNENIIEGTDKYYYRATDTLPIGGYIDTAGKTHENIPWRQSIHMPKEAARIWLKVTDVRVERLQECGNGWCLDIEKEGIVTPQNPILYISDDAFHDALRGEFQKVWNRTIKKSDIDRYGWDANPWVWVIEFERCGKPEEVRR